MTAAARRGHEARGRLAETLAVWRLRLAGARVLGRRVKTPFGEIDIVARRRDLLLIVEVKARPDRASGLQAVGHRQRRRIEQAADWYASRRSGLAALRRRYDLVIVTPRRPPHHVPDAWRPGS